MELKLQICIIFIGSVSLASIILMIRKEKLDIKYSVLWIVTSVIFIIFAIFPSIPKLFSKLIGIYEPTNAVFLALILFELCINFSLTVALSKQSAKVKDIAQALALLEKEHKM